MWWSWGYLPTCGGCRVPDGGESPGTRSEGFPCRELGRGKGGGDPVAQIGAAREGGVFHDETENFLAVMALVLAAIALCLITTFRHRRVPLWRL